MGLKTRDIKRVEVATSAGSSVLALTVPTTNGSVIRLKTELIGRRAFNSEAYCRITNHLFRNHAGTLTQRGTSQDLFFVADTDVNLSTLTFTISGTNIEIYINADPDPTVLSMSWELIVYIERN
jgi:hypothetical protein